MRLRSKNVVGMANGFGEGAIVIAWVGDVPLRRSGTEVNCLSQCCRILHWGLGSVIRVDKMEICWRADGTNIIEGVDTDAFCEIREGETLARRLVAADVRRLTPDVKPPAGGRPREQSLLTSAATNDRQRLV